MDRNKIIQASAATITAAVTIFTGFQVISMRPEPPSIDIVAQINSIMEAKTAMDKIRTSITDFTAAYKAKAGELRQVDDDVMTAAGISQKVASDVDALNSTSDSIDTKLAEFNKKADDKIKALEEEINRMEEMSSGNPPEKPQDAPPPNQNSDGPPPDDIGLSPTERLNSLVSELNSFTSGTEAEEIKNLAAEGEKLKEQLNVDFEEYKNSIKPTEKPTAKPQKKSSTGSSSSKSSSSSSKSSSSSSGSSYSSGSSSSSSSYSSGDSSSSGSSSSGSSYSSGGYSSSGSSYSSGGGGGNYSGGSYSYTPSNSSSSSGGSSSSSSGGSSSSSSSIGGASGAVSSSSNDGGGK